MDIRPLTKIDHTQWAELLASCFNRTSSDMLALLKWLDQMGYIVAWGAWNGNQLVSQYTSLLRQLCVQNNPMLAGMSINMAVHPAYRGQGLVKQVSAPVYDNIQSLGAQIGFGFSNAEGVKVDRNSKSYQYQVLGKMASYISFLPKRHSDTLILKNTFPDNDCFTCFDSYTNNISTHKTLETFRIRYAEHPFRDYKYGIWKTNGMIQGVVVYREIQRFGIQGVSLLDACGRNTGQLLRHWGCTMRHRGYKFAHTLATPQSGLVKNLHEQFRTIQLPYVRTPYYLTLRPLIKNLDESVAQLTSWDFTGGDIL